MKNGNNLLHKVAFSLLMLFPAMLFAGCAAVGIHPEPEAVVEEGAALPTRVAVLPFVNTVPDPDAGVVVRKMFYNFFSSLNYLDVEPGVVDEILRKKGLYEKLLAGEKVDERKLGQFLGVDALIFGEVTEFGKTYAVIYAEIEAGLKARMVRCKDGKALWELEHTSTIGQGDVPFSLTGLAATVVKSAINYNQAKKVSAASQLGMEMVETIPNPERVTDPPPRIEAMVHNAAQRLVRPGQSVKVVLIGDPGNEGSWEISPKAERFSLAEKEPGTYIGAYDVKPEDKVAYGRISGYLKSSKGIESQWTDVLGTVSLGEPAVLPSVVSEDLVLKADKSPYFVPEALLVGRGATLSVEPGVVLWFRKLGMVVQGRIVAKGTETMPVRISGLGASQWKGILADRGSERNILSYCEISRAEHGLRTSGASFSIDHCLFRDNGWGIVVDDGEASVKNSLVRTSEKAGISARNAVLSIAGSVVSQNQAGGVLIKDVAAEIRDNNIYNNGEYDFKTLSAEEKIAIPGNWWGKSSPETPRIVGQVDIDPVKPDPVDSSAFERIFNY